MYMFVFQNTPGVSDECWFGQGGVSLREQLKPVKGMMGGDRVEGLLIFTPLLFSFGL